MTSVVPQNFDAAFVAEIEKLIKRVKVIANYLDPYDEHATNEGPVLRDLNDWMNEVEVKFNTNELKELLPYNFFDPRKMKLPRQPGGSVITFGNTEHLQKLITFRKELLQKIDSQISALVIIKDNYKMLQKPIEIFIEHDGTIWRDDPEKFVHRSTSGNTKRVRMLKKLVGKKFVKTSTLMKELGYGDRSTLSREKRKLNENLCTNLELPQDQDVILGGNKRKYKGYQINPLYIVKIVKKGR